MGSGNTVAVVYSKLGTDDLWTEHLVLLWTPSESSAGGVFHSSFSSGLLLPPSPEVWYDRDLWTGYTMACVGEDV